MKLRLWPYLFSQAVINIMNNRLVHLIGLGTMVISLLIFGIFLLLFVNLSAWIEGWGSSLTISVYLEDGIGDHARNSVASFIKRLPDAELKRFVSKEKALSDLRNTLGPQAGLLEGLSRNPLPASFEVLFKEVGGKDSDPRKIKEQLEKFKGVDEVQYSEEWVNRFKDLMKIVRLVGLIIGGLLFMGVLFIVTNTIKLTIYSRKDEIEILKLVGATDWFVKIPYMLEGIIQGIFSGVLALLTLFLAYFFISKEKAYFFSFALLDFSFLPYEYSLAIFLLSVFLGLVGSLIAVDRFFDI